MGNAAHTTLAPSLLDQYVAVEVEYRRRESSGYPGTQNDLDGALAALPGMAASNDWPVDLSRVVLVGHSAGGQMVLVAADNAVQQAISGAKLIVPKLVVAIAPVADMVAAYDRKLSDEGDAAKLYMKCAPGDSEEALAKYHAASPMHRLPIRVPILLVSGSGDKDVPMDLVESYRDAATIAGGAPVDFIACDPSSDHYTPVNATSTEWLQIRRAIDAALV